MPLPLGTHLGPYEVTAHIGSGGMGEVYRAVDTRLNRPVALKVLPGDYAADAERRRRFEQEARTISGLDHPHICPLYDVGRESGVDYLVMPLLEGETLAKRLERAAGPLPIPEALTIATQIVDGLVRAHAHGIVHRDLKPANVMLTKDGVRLLDFGIARRAQPPAESTVVGTRPGVLVGTVGYMSPEQVQGSIIGPGSDLFSVGVLLYEMVTGRRPFTGDNEFSTMTAIVSQEPLPLAAVQPPVPPEVARVISWCLQKDLAARPASAEALLAALRALMREPAGVVVRRLHPGVVAAIVLALVALAGTAGYLWLRNARVTRARTELVPEITRLAESDTFRAHQLYKEAERIVPGDPQLMLLRGFVIARVKVETEPAGARVSIAPYGGGPWQEIGTTPFEHDAPFRESVWKFAKDGFATVELGQSLFPGMIVRATLHPPPSIPDGMVFVRGGEYRYRTGPSVNLHDYWLDRHEVTNRQFKAFVDAGGYRRDELRRFTDTTGRPGPAGWELGAFPSGTADHPVSGISWFEALAYCESVGKALPTVHHWFNASGTGDFTSIMRVSNFGSGGPAPRGKFAGIGPAGTYDMAGNVKEWAWNADGERRHLLGGAWSEPAYMFHDLDARPATERHATHGVRCAKYEAPPAAGLLAPLERPARDYTNAPPVAPAVVDAYLRHFEYDKRPLDVRAEGEQAYEHWRVQTVSIASPGGKRMPVRVYLPARGKPPYQTVIFFPGSYMYEMSDRSTLIDDWFFDFIMRSGRAVVYPTYEGSYERRIAGVRSGTTQWREMRLMWAKEVRRTVDYLETRSDVDPRRIAYYGVSLGAAYGPMLIVSEPRIRAAIFAGGGFHLFNPPGEINSFSYAPRVKTPVLMLNTRDDYLFPYETSQRPMFNALGTPASDKVHIVRDSGGHIPRRTDIARHILDWLDRWFGVVE